jgi:hypothetical protein
LPPRIRGGEPDAFRLGSHGEAQYPSPLLWGEGVGVGRSCAGAGGIRGGRLTFENASWRGSHLHAAQGNSLEPDEL